jgi:hypothetical protein
VSLRPPVGSSSFCAKRLVLGTDWYSKTSHIQVLLANIIWNGYDLLRHEAIRTIHPVTAPHNCSCAISPSCRCHAELNQLQILLHSIFSFSFKDYRQKTSLSNIASHFGSADNDRIDDIVVVPAPCTPSAPDRANATFVILARNSDLDSTVQSIRDMEDRFNRRHGYPYVFLNEVPFTDEFKTSAVSPFSLTYTPLTRAYASKGASGIS